MTKPNHAFAAAVLLISVGCSPKYYVPNTQNVPMISAKGQATVSVAGNGNQLEFQGAIGVTDSIAIQVNGDRVAPQEDVNGDGGSGQLIEGGVGYFRNLKPDVLFDVYALAGFGSMKNDFPSQINVRTTGKISADILRFSVQPSLSVQKRLFSLSGSARISTLTYSNVEGSLELGVFDQVSYLNSHKTSVLIEPALTLRVGPQRLRLQVQALRSFNVTTSDFPQDKALGTVGVIFRFR